MTNYIPLTNEEKQQMLQAIGKNSIDELFRAIPEAIKISEHLQLPPALSELQLRRTMEKMAAKNHRFTTIFRGAGAYRHFIPAVVSELSAREEFVTAYTPYQAEISQGILQSIFEYQTMICELTGMDAANASHYDGATAAAEALKMCVDRHRKTVIVMDNIHPDHLEAIKTYTRFGGMEVKILPDREGLTDLVALDASLADTVAAVYFEQPNYYGLLDDAGVIAKTVHAKGAKLIMGVNPISLGTVQTPAAAGADVAVGEGQPLGMPLSLGGPYLGFMAVKAPLTRSLPGRIVGETTDAAGKRAFVLTLQAREQHIRREKSNSSICSNEALCALTAGIYLAAMGPNGLKQVSRLCYDKAHYAAAEIAKLTGYELVYQHEFFHEFVVRSQVDSAKIMQALEKEDILGGLPLSDEETLWCFTEMNTKAEIDKLVQILKEVALNA